MSTEKTHESPVDETLEREGFSDTEDALKGADIKRGTGDTPKEFDESSDDKVTSAATEPNPKTDDPEGTP
jgi:hypothetical protein